MRIALRPDCNNAQADRAAGHTSGIRTPPGATSDVLNVISRSKFELQPVLDTIVKTAARLCRANMAHIRRRKGGVYVHIAGYGETPGFREYIRGTKVVSVGSCWRKRQSRFPMF